MAKKLKSPNRYGGVTKLSNASRRRKPYVVRITTGYEINMETGKSTQKYKIIGYARTREDGLRILADYHEHPYDLENGNMTFREVYEEWSQNKYENASQSTINGYRAAYNTCTTIFERKFRELKTKDLQDVIDQSNKNYPTIRKIKILFNQLYAYAMKMDICNKDYSRYVDIEKFNNKNPNKYDRKPFSKKEIDLFWDFRDDKYYQIVLILIYTGLRIDELLSLKKEDVSLQGHYLNIIKSKTQSGIRKVPISDYIFDFVQEWYESSKCDYLLHTEDQKKFNYRNYYDSYFVPLMERLGLSQTPHCCRHTCISLLAEAKVSPTYSKMIVGHKGAMSMTEKIYTHIDMQELIKAVNAMYYPEKIKNQ